MNELFCSLHLKLSVFALGFGDLEAGAGVEDFGEAIGDCGVSRAVVGVKEITHAQGLFFFDHNRLVPAERCAHPAILAYVPV